MKFNIFRTLSAVLLLACSMSAAAEGLKVIDPWVRSAPPNAPALGVFMTLENHSTKDQSVVAARTSLAVDRVELHRTMKVGEVMKMVPQEAIPVATRSATVLKPGSWHIMLIDPEKVPAIGDKLQLTLVLSDGSEQTVDAVVRHGKMNMQGHGHDMKHQKGCAKKNEMKHEKECKKKHEMKHGKECGKNHEMQHEMQCEKKHEMKHE